MFATCVQKVQTIISILHCNTFSLHIRTAEARACDNPYLLLVNSLPLLIVNSLPILIVNSLPLLIFNPLPHLLVNPLPLPLLTTDTIHQQTTPYLFGSRAACKVDVDHALASTRTSVPVVILQT